MQIKQGKWFEVIVRYDKDGENGNRKSVKEQYAFNVASFGEAEVCAIEQLAPLASGAFDVVNINPAPYNEVFLTSEAEGVFFIVKIEVATVDESHGKEKKTVQTYLVQAATLEAARKNTETVLNDSLVDYSFKTITKSKTLEVFDKTDK